MTFTAFIQVLTFAHFVSAEFGVTYPSLEAADVIVKSDSTWHLGGFCLGHSDDKKVGELEVSLVWKGTADLPSASRSGAYLVAFDGRDSHWGRAKNTLDSSSCNEQLDLATSFMHFPGIRPWEDNTFTININQVTDTRDWHFVLLICGAIEEAPLKLSIQGTKGTLSIFEANTQFDSSSCPVMPVNWWQQAKSEFGFWALLLGVFAMSSASVCLLRCCWLHFHRTRELRDAAVSESNVVVGKPCATPDHGSVAMGQPNAKGSSGKVQPV